MRNKTPGIIALTGAPFLFIGYFVESNWPRYEDSSFTGVWGLIYITGWMCTMLAFQRAGVTGNSRFGKSILWIILATLSLANLSNIVQLFVPANKPAWFFYIDLFWPLSNLLMLPVGIAVIKARQVSGWKRYWPFITGLWFPVSIGALILFGKNEVTMMVGGIYSLIAWSILAYSCFHLPHHKLNSDRSAKNIVTA